MHLHENIREYYYGHFGELSIGKQFHFASRLGTWNTDPKAVQYLRELRSYTVPDALTDKSLSNMLADLAAQEPTKHANASQLRADSFAAYPTLQGVSLALFRVRHLLAIYGIDARPALAGVAPTKGLLELQAALLADKHAMRMLSTYAVNFFYLLNRVIIGREDGISLDDLYELGDGYDQTDPSQLQLLMYLYTHCIIGESNFYARDIPEQKLPIYQKMLARLDKAVDTHFDQMSLDTKLEFLVCTRLCGYSAASEQRILDECTASMSPSGTFVVDTHNAFASIDTKKSFEASEHRNVLFIMACTPRQLKRGQILG
jgi:hypothetical protein